MIYIVYIALLPFSNWLFLNVFFLDFPNTFRLICARFVFLGYISSSPFRFFIFIYNIIFINFHVGTSNGFSRTSQIFRFQFRFLFLLFFFCFLVFFFLRVSHYHQNFVVDFQFWFIWFMVWRCLRPLMMIQLASWKRLGRSKIKRPGQTVQRFSFPVPVPVSVPPLGPSV